ncbi:SIS domain-containing protein [Desulfobacula toluolica]|uniref:Glutamine--fructose-6-phosphate aminotransferase [isomerizing] n=1 Tax=Desulfobacula toluolica (strain DSM 7467 / Tol2) TaxID=651182 RepID=K0NEJ8_DESTT|nr:SIS domain-containing protein [Desulfobacula toluolica]CCK79486.1 GlmS: glucosamine--fructose-6-phosphate aminotransferase [Desulfobacula toluolica Tol2]
MKLYGKMFSSLFFNQIKKLFSTNIEFGKSMTAAKENSIIVFPDKPNTVSCGISAFIAFKGNNPPQQFDLDQILKRVLSLKTGSLSTDAISITDDFLCGDDFLNRLFEKCQGLKQENVFSNLFFSKEKKELLASITGHIDKLITDQTSLFKKKSANLSAKDAKTISLRLETLHDISWCLKKEIANNITAISNLAKGLEDSGNSEGLNVFKRINAVLNSIDRLEVRGRDSAGISVMFTFPKQEFENFRNDLINTGLSDRLKQRTNRRVLINNSLTINDTFMQDQNHFISISFVYKFAAEIGSLGDNISFIRNQIKNDLILQLLVNYKFVANSISAHTRWASVGDITEANCHPQDNTSIDKKITQTGIVHVCLNGDIDNYLELKTEYEARYEKIHEDINTDTKLIPLQIEHYLKHDNTIEEAFRLAVNDFEGSHAISMHTDLAPGKLFLAQKGSGQAIFVGIAQDHYIAASELYGIVEETPKYIKLNGEKKGQIVILDQKSEGGVSGIQSFYYDSTPIQIEKDHVLTSKITSRDIDRQNFPHYFLKEISESPDSVEKTLENKFKLSPKTSLFSTILDETVIPRSLEEDIKNNKIKKVHFIGQGTAGVAAQGCADLLNFYMKDMAIDIRALKSSELSGFCIAEEKNTEKTMADTLVVAISQSGTTTDTNRTVDMVKACGAKTLAIVNRRDSDLTFKTDGVFYTSSGRDIEMSVASTKAFYSQLAAGAVLGLHIAGMTKTRSNEFITEQINDIMDLPDKMRTILAMKEQIKESAYRCAVSKNYWATVGSGSNKTSADEIRIKLSELCYKTISSDFIEDKKHIDLSSEPLIIICAAGTRESVLGDIIKDTAIFHAHKATPVVITTIGEDRFDLYARDVFKIPEIKEHFAPVLNTLVGHIWGYYAALAINEGSRFMYKGRAQVQNLLEEYTSMGHDVYEVLLEKKFRETIAQFYNDFSKKRRQGGFPAAMGLDNVANLTLLLKYLSGRLPVSDFEIDFETKGTPSNMLDTFFDTMGQAINTLARPVDAIKHQAKTVTVGTSRIREKFEGLVFDELAANHIQISQVTNTNVLVIKNLQEVISRINGALLYQISGLNLLGEVNHETKIKIVNKTGSLKDKPSRVETDPRLKGTKNIIVREGNVYIGKGRKDKKNILVIPIISSNPATPNIIEYILSLNINFKPSSEVSLLKKIKALGGKYNRLKDWILESDNFQWDDKYLNLVEVETLFGDTAEKVVEKIVNQIN